jgi:hypothetical protein
MPLWLRYSSEVAGGDTNDMAIYMATVPNQGAPNANEAGGGLQRCGTRPFDTKHDHFAKTGSGQT